MSYLFRFSIVLALFLMINRCFSLIDLFSADPRCRIASSPELTVFNLNHYCSYEQLVNLFHNAPAGRFPSSKGALKGHVLLCPGGACALLEQIAQQVWNGKAFLYTGGARPNDRGLVYNRILRSMDLFFADVYRVNAPFDDREAILIDYLRDPFTFIIRDYIREVAPNLYLGIMTLRPTPTIPVLFFMLEVVPK